MCSNIVYFPLTTYCYYTGINRWAEPYNFDETPAYCGPQDRCCIDCYFCLTPLAFIIDLISINSLQCIKINKESN